MGEHKGTYIAGHVGEEELKKLEMVMDALESVTGNRNRAEALRYILKHFDFDASQLGKSLALAARVA